MQIFLLIIKRERRLNLIYYICIMKDSLFIIKDVFIRYIFTILNAKKLIKRLTLLSIYLYKFSPRV